MPIDINVYNQSGAVTGTMTLDETVFGAEYNEPAIHQVVVAQLANGRQGTKCTLTRTEVRGGGKKPYRQKHTGRARQGSTRAPQWIKGGVVFAPKPRDFSKKVNFKAKAVAMRSALSKKLADGELIVLDAIKLAQPKTKEVATILNNLKLNDNVLLVTTADNAELLRAGQNIPNLTIVADNLVNVYSLVRNNHCVVIQDAVKNIEEAYKI